MGLKSGFVAINGRPNVGKSTLVNKILKQKIAIMSPKAQTTRNKISCVYNDEDSQIIFIDTPGIHKPHDLLGEYMNREALSAARGVEVILLIVDGSMNIGAGDEFVLSTLRDKKTPVILVINKIDLISKEELFKTIDAWKNQYDFLSIIPISALNGKNVDTLITEIKKLLPEGPKYYPDNMICDHPESFIIAELIREKILMYTHEEVPHGVAVYTELIKKGPHNTIEVNATIVVERDSQKGIIIGKQGSMIKRIGISARQDIEALLGSRVNLETFVRVEANWRNKPHNLDEFGFKKEE